MYDKEDFDYWKVRMEGHLSALDDDMWYVIANGPLEIMKIIPSTLEGGEPRIIEKPRIEWTMEDKKKNNLDRIAKDILY
ncbi:hypothetical protein, partial [Serratia marcescens]|uniref:hypothetical protein n=1 Tax=Serratia marcescens TaxID=615 RepID=UPI0028135ADB